MGQNTLPWDQLKNKQIKIFCFTIFPSRNATTFTKQEQALQCYLDNTCSFAFYQLEECPETKKTHFQGAGRLNEETKQRRLGTIKNQLRRIIGDGYSIRLNPCDGTLYESFIYCTDEKKRVIGTAAWQCGDPENLKVTERARTDLNRLVRELKEGNEDYLNENPKYELIYCQGIENLRAKRRKLEDKKLYDDSNDVLCLCFWGEAGTGKTRLAHAISRYLRGALNWQVYKPMMRGKGCIYWDGYDGEEIVIIDDFCNDIPYRHFTNLFDRYHYPLDSRGKMVTIKKWKVIILTTNLDFPHQFYPNTQITVPSAKGAIKRRLYDIRFFNPVAHRNVFLYEPDPVLRNACEFFGIDYSTFFGIEQEEEEDSDPEDGSTEILEQANLFPVTIDLTNN